MEEVNGYKEAVADQRKESVGFPWLLPFGYSEIRSTLNIFEAAMRFTTEMRWQNPPSIDIFFLAALGLRCCVRAFSSCGERRLLFVVVRGLLIAVASLVAEHGLWARRLSSSGTRT